MSLTHLRLDRPVEGVAVLVLDRAQAQNALDAALVASLTAAVADLAEDAAEGGLRALVVTGSGEWFCSGLDPFDGGGPTVDHTTLDDLRYFPVPVVAAVNGAAIGGGLELALAADFRIAGPGAVFADDHLGRSRVPMWGLTARLPQEVGQAWARRLSLTGARIDATTACRIGLVTEVTTEPDPTGRAVALAAAIAQADPGPAQRVRALYDLGRDADAGQVVAAEVEQSERSGAGVGHEPGPPRVDVVAGDAVLQRPTDRSIGM